MRTIGQIHGIVRPKRTQTEYELPPVKYGAHHSWSKPAEAQSECAFLTRLPVELRYIIYEYVFALSGEQYKEAIAIVNNGNVGADDNLNDDFQVEFELFLRPRQRTAEEEQEEYMHYQPTGVPLLQLCQSIHAEAEPLIIGASTHYLIYPPIGPVSYPVTDRARFYLKSMRHEQIAQIKSLHLFVGSNRLSCPSHPSEARVTRNTIKRVQPREKTGSYKADNPLAEIGAIRCGGIHEIERLPFNPKHLTITIRATDWCTRGRIRGRIRSKYSLAHFLANKYWGSVFNGLKTLSFELEIKKTRKSLLQPAIANLRKFVFDIGDGEKLVPEGDVREYEYIGYPTTVTSYDDACNILTTVTRPVSYLIFKFFWRLQRPHEKPVV